MRELVDFTKTVDLKHDSKVLQLDPLAFQETSCGHDDLGKSNHHKSPFHHQVGSPWISSVLNGFPTLVHPSGR